MYGALGYRRWLTAHNRRVLRATLPPSDDEFDMEAWDALSDEALANFEGKLDGDFGILSDYLPDSGLRVCWPQEEWKRHMLFPCTTDSVGYGPPRNGPMNPLYGRTTSGG